MTAGISIHVVDVARGVVASGLTILVERLDGEPRSLIAKGQLPFVIRPATHFLTPAPSNA